MTQKLFLTSALAMGVMAPAMAEPSNTGEFPSTGLMQEDYKYTEAATEENMGVYEGEVNAVAEYDIIDYIVNAGQYLPADSETVITCPAGSYCPGIDGNVQYNQSAPQGIQTCPTGYDSSAAGASSDTQCYRQCSGNVTIEHATGVTGNDYYGNGADTCEPTDCVNGWHIKEGKSLWDVISNVESYDDTGTSKFGHTNSSGTYSVDSGNWYGQGDNTFSPFLINFSGSPNMWEAYYGFAKGGGGRGLVFGQGFCSSQSGSLGIEDVTSVEDVAIATTISTESGQYCWCNVTGYQLTQNSVIQNLSSSWAYIKLFNDPNVDGTCDGSCAQYCARYMAQTKNSYSSATSDKGKFLREALFKTVNESLTLSTCEANTITIHWSDASQTDIDANNAGTATYGEDVRTPVKAATKKGQTFRGWRFSKPEQTNLSD